MRRFLHACLFFAVALTGRTAEGAAIDLGEGLSYLRLVRVDGPAAFGIAGPVVLDLRRAVVTDEAAAESFAAPLRTPGPLRFILVNQQTDPALLARLESRAPSVLLLGAGPARPGLDLALPITSEEDLRAYDAHDQGADLSRLIQPPVRKTRRDEAAIVRSRANGASGQAGEGRKVAGDEEDPPAEGTNGEPPEPLLVDAVLQRAVHLHRGLKALGRL